MTTGRINQISDLLTENVHLPKAGPQAGTPRLHTGRVACRTRTRKEHREALRLLRGLRRRIREYHRAEEKATSSRELSRKETAFSACLPRLSQDSPRLPRTRSSTPYIINRMPVDSKKLAEKTITAESPALGAMLRSTEVVRRGTGRCEASSYLTIGIKMTA